MSIRRKRDIAFVDEVLSTGIPITDEDKARLAKKVYPSMEKYPVAALCAKVDQKLSQPDIREAIRDAYGLLGFHPVDAIKLHIDHIQGNVTKEVCTKEGVEQVRLPANYAALKDYNAIVLGEAARKVETRNLHVHAEAPPMRDGPPQTRPRVLGNSVDADSEFDG